MEVSAPRVAAGSVATQRNWHRFHGLAGPTKTPQITRFDTVLASPVVRDTRYFASLYAWAAYRTTW